MIAELWTGYLSGICSPNNVICSLSAADAANMMILFKMARAITATVQKADTYIDIAGYAACAAELACGGISDETV